jgi:hypothetical protein
MTDLQIAQFLEAACRSTRFSIAGPANKVGLAISCGPSSRSPGSIPTAIIQMIGCGISILTLTLEANRREHAPGG